MDKHIDSSFPIDTQSFSFDTPFGTLSWVPTPDVIAELRGMAERVRATSSEQHGSPAFAMHVMFGAMSQQFTELAVAALLGVEETGTFFKPVEVIEVLEKLKVSKQMQGFWPEGMATLAMKEAVSKCK